MSRNPTDMDNHMDDRGLRGNLGASLLGEATARGVARAHARLAVEGTEPPRALHDSPGRVGRPPTGANRTGDPMGRARQSRGVRPRVTAAESRTRISDEVSPVELLFDLVFIFALSQLSHHLLDHLTARVLPRPSSCSSACPASGATPASRPPR